MSRVASMLDTCPAGKQHPTSISRSNALDNGQPNGSRQRPIQDSRRIHHPRPFVTGGSPSPPQGDPSAVVSNLSLGCAQSSPDIQQEID